MRLHISHAFLSIAISALVAGCSSTTEPTTQSTPRPGPGSTFTYHVQHVDKSGATVADSSVTYTVLDTGITYAGKSGVVRVIDAASDTVAFTYISNGIMMYRPRIDIFQGVALPEVWMPIDTTSSQTRTLYNQNDTVSYSGTMLYFASHAEMIPMSDTSITVGSKAFNAIRWKTRSAVTVTVAITGQATTTVVEGIRAFAPEVGFLVADQTVVSGATAQSPVQDGTETSTLTAFVKK